MPKDNQSRQSTANKRGTARLAAVQALYQMDITGAPLLEVIAEYENYRLGREIDDVQYLAADAQWFRAIILGVVKQQSYFDPLIQQRLTGDWTLSRLNSILRAILRAACFELKYKIEVPVAVIINEYVDITKAFFLHEESKIVHAVLDQLAKSLRSD